MDLGGVVRDEPFANLLMDSIEKHALDAICFAGRRDVQSGGVLDYFGI